MGRFPAGQDAFGLKSSFKPSPGFRFSALSRRYPVNAYDLPSQSPQALKRMLHPRQGKLITMLLQIPITQPTNRPQVLRLPIPIIPIQIIHRQNMAPHLETFRPPAILTPILSTCLYKLDHPLKQIQPSLIPRFEEMVYVLLGGQPLHTHFPSSKPTRLCIAFHPPMRPPTIPGRFPHGNQFGYFRFLLSHCIIHHPGGYSLVKPGGPLLIERMFYPYFTTDSCLCKVSPLSPLATTP